MGSGQNKQKASCDFQIERVMEGGGIIHADGLSMISGDAPFQCRLKLAPVTAHKASGITADYKASVARASSMP